jgi:NADH-quinone oxidoreductase subunit L
VSGWWLPAAPFAAALVGLALGRAGRATTATIAVLGATAALVISVVILAASPWTQPRADSLGTVPTGWVDIDILAVIDGLAACVAVMVAVVALLVQVYSVAYLHDDPRYASYAALVSLFTAAMLLVVVAGDLIVLLVGWEVMGICSYFLVGHHWELPEARPAAVKAFLTTRVGDVGFVFGIFVLATAAGSSRIDAIIEAVPEMSQGTLTAAALLLACGVVGKSAQFPLHTWLPDAMAGPTPISALIHAATMVAAGIYLVVRLYPVFEGSTFVLFVLACIACVTMLGAALAALAQDDIKRVLAYSTVSQLAYMLAALAVGSPDAAVFHLLTHAAFKALLFLAAGAVIHAVLTNSMQGMGGLRERMPVTFWTMTLALAALVGVPPLAGFFSKESILGAAEHAAAGEELVAAWVGWMVLITALVTVAVTAAYATRLWLRTFFGDSRVAAGVHPHEAPALMRWPLVALAVPTVGLGMVGLAQTWLPTWLDPAGFAEPQAEPLTPTLLTAIPSLLAVTLGGWAAYRLWQRDTAEDPAVALGRWRPLLDNAFYVDTGYDRAFVRPVRAIARGTVLVDDNVVDELVEEAGRSTMRAGRLFRLTVTGNAQGYLTSALGGAAVLAAVIGAVSLL